HLLANFPLLLLSIYFPWLLSLAVASMALSLGVCGVAAAQAELPPGKSRFWSRPLVACLFFLQPLVRGWARYRSRLHFRPCSCSAGLEATGFLRQTQASEQLYFCS